MSDSDEYSDENPTWTEKPRRDGKPHGEWKVCPGFEPAEKMDAWYNGGRPLFPRKELQEIHDQLRRPLRNGNLIFVRGFDGQWYEYVVRTGGRQEHDGKTYRLSRPQISYTDFETLKEKVDPDILSHLDCPCEATRNPSRRVHGEYPPRKEDDGRCGSLGKSPGLSQGGVDLINDEPAAQDYKHHRLLQASHLGPREVPCYVQDPAYTPADRMVLAENNVETVQDPGGFLKMDDSSLVFCCEPTTCVKSIVANVARPLVIIRDTVVGSPYCTAESWDPDCPRVVAMMKDYNALDFPEDGNFGDMTIYVRRDARYKKLK
ncbi:hypothetical protein ASPCAL13210 [Aspergillus calidoustus]|uniref:SRR1-like domain-containing protein n=1 Tax=Aspergillus calidoustus TaxID=454130 RepID=A0A0U5GEH9_ASPCI|nr:hypothetical protein ASPCAL13210 [Aspergillus calidoustus]